ncbi:DUF2459 domain-containing protein [Methylicorpusculum oleiharenae]|uniref:DUF2459 domain-containing protein n=1 Tax=Methylicorpusculum oleiharenae TaxID=1338687 RepID=UPI00135AE9F0|nr:DUF2459 domain-containing protein [Methylicorpusculum oleiharenae]MCD2452331.1 DUF2459 domain-containing protein [Methylicorpusculum oleiharenae]
MKLFVFPLILLVLLGCAVKNVASHTVEPDGKVVYVVDHGLHAGIVIDAKVVAGVIAGLPFNGEAVRFIEFGWGDQAFYQAESFSLFLAIKALLLPTDSVMHVVGLPYDPGIYFRSSEVQRIRISPMRLNAMLNYIDRSFTRDGQGQLIDLGRGLYGESRFYAANGNYHLFNNCNTWVMSVLIQAGMPEPMMVTLGANSVMRQVRAYQNQSAEPVK